eukprot:5720987-Amphidinium_carterae.1
MVSNLDSGHVGAKERLLYYRSFIAGGFCRNSIAVGGLLEEIWIDLNPTRFRCCSKRYKMGEDEELQTSVSGIDMNK